MLVVADTGPLHYLVLIAQIDILPQLFGSVSVPMVAREELDRPLTPAPVREWIEAPPSWLSVLPEPPSDTDIALSALDDGERGAIALAAEIHADLLLMDDRAGVAAARARGLAVTGTLGLLDRAARRGLIDLAAAFAALQATSFHARPELLDGLLAAWRNDRSNR